jgi:hypothetical protein
VPHGYMTDNLTKDTGTTRDGLCASGASIRDVLALAVAAGDWICKHLWRFG